MNRLFNIVIFLLLGITSPYAQTINELELSRKKTEEQISITNKMLENTRKEREQSLNQLELLNTKINLQKNLITDIDTQIKLLEAEIQDKNFLVFGLQNDLDNLRKEYAKLIRFAWKNQSNMQIIMFIFAATDFNQSYRRLRFYQQFIRFREKQANEIIETSKMIEEELYSLNITRSELASFQALRRNEVEVLTSEQHNYSRTVRALQQKERQLRKELEDNQKAMEAISKAIEEMIAEEVRKAEETKRAIVRDSRYLSLSSGFEGNKGRLPWPASPGVIVGQFGEHNHPVLKGVKVKNNGIDINTQPNGAVKAIFDGEVKRIVNIPGANVAVIIRHGDYLTVYSNLAVVIIKSGDMVRADQPIGNVFTDQNSGKSVVNLQIWKENQLLNPKDWILP